MKRHFIPMLAGSLLGLLASSGFSAGQTYTLTDLGTDTMPYGVNDIGQVAGAITYPATRSQASYTRGFILSGGVKTPLGTLGGTFSMPGPSTLTGKSSGMLMFPAAATTGGLTSWEKGQVVGWAFDAAGAYRAFVWDDVNRMRDLTNVSNARHRWVPDERSRHQQYRENRRKRFLYRQKEHANPRLRVYSLRLPQAGTLRGCAGERVGKKCVQLSPFVA